MLNWHMDMIGVYTNGAIKMNIDSVGGRWVAYVFPSFVTFSVIYTKPRYRLEKKIMEIMKVRYRYSNQV